MPRHTIKDFSGGLVTFQSNKDIQENQYQKFSDVNNSKLGLIQKPNTNTGKSAADTSANETIYGRGFFTYRTQYDATPAQTNTQWYLYGENVASTPRIRRYDSSDGTGGTWSDVITNSDWTSQSHNPSYLAHNDILRISDGELSTANTTKWYGHIKRDIFGQSITYSTSSKFSQPADASAENTWLLQSTDLTPPTVVQMKGAFDKGGAVDSANEVGLFIHYPSNGAGDYKIHDDLASNTFTASDRYTVTFEYDYTQESALAKNSDGTIGVLANNFSSDQKVVPAINLVMNTTSFNKRITGINIYWKPSEIASASNIDWYHVAHLDIDKGWSDDYRATEISEYAAGYFFKKNMGYWLPCPDLTHAQAQGSSNNIDSGDADTWTASLISINIASAWSAGDIVWAGNDTDISTALNMTDTLIGEIEGFTGTDTVESQYNFCTYRGEEDSSPTNDTSGSGSRYMYAKPKASNKVATWYIPNDGILGSTYNSLTGRAAEQEIESHRWKTAVVVDGKAFYGNVKTKDENDQDVKYDSRIYYTSNGNLDEIYAYRYIDVGRSDGDSIFSLQAWGSRLFVFKKRNTYIYNVGGNKIFEERRFKGVGCDNRYVVTQTPYGIVSCDTRQVSLLTPTNAVELSYPIRSTWQGLTLDRPSTAYDAINNRIVIATDSDGTTSQTFYIYDFDTKSWSTETHKATSGTLQKISNMIMGDNLYPLFMEDYHDETSTDFARVLEFASNSSTSSNNAIIKTKRFDFDIPDLKKRFHHIYLTYKAGGNVTVKLFTNGNTTESGAEYQSLTFSSQSTKDSAGKLIKMIGKTLEVQVECAETDFELDDIEIDFEIIGRNP